MAINKSIKGKDGFERTYHKIPSFTVFLKPDGTCQLQIVVQNWKDGEAREENAEAQNLQHSILGLPSGIMQIGYEMLKRYFPEYAEGEDILTDDWKKPHKSGKITAVTQDMRGKLIEKREIKETQNGKDGSNTDSSK